MRVTPVLFLGLGIWLLYISFRGVVPETWNPGEKKLPGEKMRRGQRLLFAVGGVLLTGLGISLVLRH